MSAQVQVNTNVYAQQVQQKVQEAYHFRPDGERPTCAVEAGRKYFKLVVDYGNQRCVHSFVDRVTGDVFKPEGWAKPAKGVRFNLIQNIDTLLTAVDPYGSYLYQR